MLGRPEFKPTDEQREQVRLMKSDGWSQDRIAERLEIDRNTLAKHFSAEIQRGGDEIRLIALELILKSARAGNVSAQKQLLHIANRAIADEFLNQPHRPIRVQPLGKKEAAAEEALNPDVDGSWGDDLISPSSKTVQ